MRKTKQERLQIRAMYENRLTMPPAEKPLGYGPSLARQRLGNDFHKKPSCKRGERPDWSFDWRKDLSIRAINRKAV